MRQVLVAAALSFGAVTALAGPAFADPLVCTGTVTQNPDGSTTCQVTPAIEVPGVITVGGTEMTYYPSDRTFEEEVLHCLDNLQPTGSVCPEPGGDPQH